MVVNITSCSESDNDETNEELSVILKRDDKVLTILEVLPVHMCWQQIFHLLEEMREQIIVAIRQAKLYADKVKGCITYAQSCPMCHL